MENTNQNQQFEIRRGMVFFIDLTKMTGIPKSEFTPTKNRPYVVLSNDKCNENSGLIHVAPIYTRDYDETGRMWYNIPFKGNDGRNSVIDIAQIQLIPKSFCTSTNYSGSLTSKVRFNKDLMDAVDSAILRQFDIGADRIARPETRELMQTYPVMNYPVPQIQMPNITLPSITLNISVNGVPVDNQDISVTAETSEDVNAKTPISKKIESKTVKRVAKKADKSVSTTTGFEKIELKPFQGMTDDQRSRLYAFIKENYEKFGGNMSIASIARETGVSEPTVRKSIIEIDENIFNEKRTGRKSKYSLPQSMYAEFLEFYKTYGIQETLRKYSKFGFKKQKDITDKLTSMKRYIKRHKEKVSVK